MSARHSRVDHGNAHTLAGKTAKAGDAAPHLRRASGFGRCGDHPLHARVTREVRHVRIAAHCFELTAGDFEDRGATKRFLHDGAVSLGERLNRRFGAGDDDARGVVSPGRQSRFEILRKARAMRSGVNGRWNEGEDEKQRGTRDPAGEQTR